MAATTKSRPKAAAVSRGTVVTAGSFLETLPEKPKEEMSLRESMGHLRESVQAALAKGYSYQDLADLLGKQGISISATTLKNYVPSGKRQASKASKASAGKTTIKRGRKPKATASANGSAESVKGTNGKAPAKSSRTSSASKSKTTSSKAKAAPSTRAKTSTRAKSSTAATSRRKKTG